MKSFTTLFILAIATLSIAAPSPIPQAPAIPGDYQAKCDKSCDGLCRQFVRFKRLVILKLKRSTAVAR
ncbi:hypothetical protein HYFRA_00007647 [Hymenoscyphus fraxineus]|uniref:Uncharacterized protein n=1 Tax=Hymenoscyphus fraxineus TaxID=746836 RepID=A0A9N9KWT2_9HELO|nr:hypothetical protein HYFRA_00007647 [Hymenoscyphus fraxineus]